MYRFTYSLLRKLLLILMLTGSFGSVAYAQQTITVKDKGGKQYYVQGKHEYRPISQWKINANNKMVQNTNW